MIILAKENNIVSENATSKKHDYEVLGTGLNLTDVERSRKQFGFNEIPEKKVKPWLQFIKRFWGLTAWLLEIIIVLSIFLQRYADVCIILGLLVLNAVLGFEEEVRASKVVDALKEKLRVNARVLREGVWSVLPAREIVPGDVVRVRSGDCVPADVKVVSGRLDIDQSVLTGESFSVDRGLGDILFSGSVVKGGEANCVVMSTGADTYFGRTAHLVELAKPKLYIEKVISSVVHWLLVIVSVLAIVALVCSVLRGFGVVETLPILLIILLSAIPVALPAMFTVSMALGAMELSKKGVLVTRLSAVEDAATMNVLCVDKTGTITKNKLSVVKTLACNGFSEKDVVFYGALASKIANHDPIDLAFIDAAKQEELPIGAVVQTSFVPFDPKTRCTEAVMQKDNERFRVMKGAVRVIGEACKLTGTEKKLLYEQTQKYALKGYRTLAVAKTDHEEKLRLVGLAALYDAPRPDSKQLIHELNELGISVKMLTGDALPIAKETAKNVGLGERIVLISSLKADCKKESLFAELEVMESDVFAEVFPEDKYTIVKNLQDSKHIVGMTGDGVNDAPALKQAEVGIAVNNATDVAKSAASVVLVNEGLTSIVDLVKNGRVIYERITAWILSKIIRTLQVSVFTVLTFLLTGNYAISAFGVILYFFLTDPVKIALSTDKLQGSNKPATWKIYGAVKTAAILGTFVIVESIALLYLTLNVFNVSINNPAIYTYTFEILFYSALFLNFNVRERRPFYKSKPSKILTLTIIASLIAGTILVTVGIPNLTAVPVAETLIILGLSAFFSFIVNDIVKVFTVQKLKIQW
ncbi:MAG: plasma-membrane proton-efflux P-type ATPase [Nitrososphaerota archaeon]|jgi:H+-transporting ATPase|nr:plasma-membrane proton-efflux P-type ATPase [Nitrososphaerota archaeon]